MENAEKSGVKWMDVNAGQAGQRIDNFLLRVLKGVPKSRIYRLLRKGEVRVNRGRIRADYRLKEGDQVRIPPVRMAERQAPNPTAGALDVLAGSIIYEDERLLVLDKPAGMAVHGGSGLSFGVIEALRALRPEAPYLELVHRLDRDTSGCLLIAKRRSELRTLHELLRSFLEGYGTASLMEAVLKTGRTHQIRVHAAHAGHPLAGDAKYGDVEFNRELRKPGLKRLFLHAHFVAFRDEERQREIEVSAPLAPDLRKLIQQLE